MNIHHFSRQKLRTRMTKTRINRPRAAHILPGVAIATIISTMSIVPSGATERDLGALSGSVVVNVNGEKSKCSGVWVNDNWFVTAHHCVLDVTDPALLSIIDQNSTPVVDIVTVPGKEVSFLRVETSEPEPCLGLDDLPARIGTSVTVVTRNHATNAPHGEEMQVNEVEHRTNNPDLGVTTKYLLLTSKTGYTTLDGDSGAGVFSLDSQNRPALSGLVVGVSTSTNGVLVEPTYNLHKEFQKIIGQCEDV